MALVLCFEHGMLVIRFEEFEGLEGIMEKSRCVLVHMEPENADGQRRVYKLPMTKDVYLQMMDRAESSVKSALENAAEENGCGTVTPATVIKALQAVDPAFSLSCDEVMAMSDPVPADYFCDFRDGDGDSLLDCDDGGDGESDDGDHSDDGNHSGDDEIRYFADLDEPMLPHNGCCGNCMGKLVNVKATEGRYLLSRQRCVSCGQGA